MPGTPTFAKAVHFDSQLEHIRHFLQVDRPLAVSAGSSPVDNYESDTEYPFSGDVPTASRPPTFEWEIIMTNFPVETPARKAQPVHLERVWLSSDQKCLIGSVAVANFAFQKSVACRFTLDYWKTTSEVAAEYVCEVRPVDTPHGQDRFNFTIKLSDMANLESKTLYFCIRYNVNGQEYWDNNGGMNFQVDFRKKMLPQSTKKLSRTTGGLPKSSRRPSLPAAQKVKQTPTSTDEFGDSPKLNPSQPIHEYIGESGPTGLRLKGAKFPANIASDNLSTRLPAPSGQLANRYDFGASLSAAIQTAKDAMAAKPDGLYMKSAKKANAPPAASLESVDKTKQPAVVDPKSTNAVPRFSAADSPNASISSASYEEIVNKWCFFGSKQTSPQPKGLPPRFGHFDGADDASRSTHSSTSASYEGSPVGMGNYYHTHSGTQHHSLHPNDPNPYFQQAPLFMSMGATPVSSPLKDLSPQRPEGPMTGPSWTTPGYDQTSGRSPQPPTLAGNYTPLTAIRG
ncbi:hypothetical protein VTK56DRAFT_10144 [Thermocarpiscus australiensis]